MRTRGRRGATVVTFLFLACDSSGGGGVVFDAGPCATPGTILVDGAGCLSDIGSYCAAGSTCASGRCSGGVCAAPPVANGGACDEDADCQAGVCDMATMQCGAVASGTACFRDEECTSGVCACGDEDPACSYYGMSTCGARGDGGRCGRDEDCSGGHCDVAERSCGAQQDGYLCSSSADCVSTFCQSGRCVDMLTDAGTFDGATGEDVSPDVRDGAAAQ